MDVIDYIMMENDTLNLIQKADGEEWEIDRKRAGRGFRAEIRA